MLEDFSREEECSLCCDLIDLRHTPGKEASVDIAAKNMLTSLFGVQLDLDDTTGAVC